MSHDSTKFCKREVSQIGNVDVDVNVDVESHPVGHNPPQLPMFFFYSEPNSTLTLTIFLKKGADKIKANITNEENKTFLA